MQQYKNHSEKLPMIDLFTGLAGFSLAGERTGRFKTILTSEVDSYCTKLIEHNFNYENAGCITGLGIPQELHPDKELMNDNLVPCEETGLSSICLEDFFSGAMEFPFLVTGGFPCQDITPANTKAVGITGERSSLVEDQLRIIRDLEPPYAVFENSEMLVSRGLDEILKELNDMGYIVEWETMTATAFGYPHYRHRCYIVAYLPSTKAALSSQSIFDLVRSRVPETPEWKLPLNTPDNAQSILERAVIEIPRSIKLRTKRINALGNSIIPDIAQAILQAVVDIEDGLEYGLNIEKPIHSELSSNVWMTPVLDLFDDSTSIVKFPKSGTMNRGTCYTPLKPCRKLNPTKTQFNNMFSTLLSKNDANNNFSPSRRNRPGKLGGLLGDLIRLGADVGGLHPNYAERMMGYETDYTMLRVA
jgi:DNA (cytosine-5)-methyltransferase 1